MKKKGIRDSNSTTVAVVGNGSWATAIVKVLTLKGLQVRWWIRREEMAEFVSDHGHNPHYLSAVHLPIQQLTISTDVSEVVKKAEVVVFCVPSFYFLKTIQKLAPAELDGKVIVSAIKGMVPGKKQLISTYLNESYKVDENRLVAITGPCHAEEVAGEKLSYLTFASKNLAVAQETAALFNCRFITSTVSEDIEGTELAAVLKNVCAIASGICHGLGYGDNFQAVLIANAMKEIEAMLNAVYPHKRNILDSAYLGDLLVTAYSQFSRNRTFGIMIGKGYSVKHAQIEMDMVAEGYYAVKPLFELNENYKVEMPILTAVYHILYEKIAVPIEIRLMADKFN
ncbi:MAG: NAD(P)H-dependent glycerol-3-phosphate dehydrogenase [Bacteroidia bacterium]